MTIPTKKLDAFIKNHLKLTSNHIKKYKMENVLALCEMTREIMKNGPMMVRMGVPCVVVGNIMGQYKDLLRIFAALRETGRTGALTHNFMFLGGYVDRGKQGLSCLLLLFALKCRFPDCYELLRGTHELANINKKYGFYDEILDHFGGDKAIAEKIWNAFNETFSWMPVAGLIGNQIFCVHGGLSPLLHSFEDIEKISRPIINSTESPLANDLIWSDPTTSESGFLAKENGAGYYFGKDVVYSACDRLKITLIVRGSTIIKNGYGKMANDKLCSIYSAPLCAGAKNMAAVLRINEHGGMGFTVISPEKFLRASGSTVEEIPEDISLTDPATEE